MNNKITPIHPNAHPVPPCPPMDRIRVAAVAGCGTQTALAAVRMIETPAGLHAALASERNTLARSAIINALKTRIHEGGAK